MEYTWGLFLSEMLSVTVFFALGRLVQHFLNIGKKPYVVRNVYDPNLISVFIYRLKKYGNGHVEYIFRNEDGSWKPVINKKNFIGGAIAVAIMIGILICLTGIKGTLILGGPIALFAVVETAARYYEAYRLLMKC